MPADRSAIFLMRQRRFATAREASYELGCSTIHLHQIERGAGTPSWELEQKMSEVYRVRREHVGRAWRRARRAYLRAELEKLL